MSDVNDLDRRLSELFADRNLGLAPLPGATGLVLTRVRRARRRRRAIQVAAPVLAALLVGGVALSGLGSQLFATPVPPARHATPVVTLESGELPMSGTSVGPLRLGMSQAQAEATGLLQTPGEPAYDHAGCWIYQGKKGILEAAIGPNGVRRISVYTWIRTQEDAGIGDTYAQLRQQFPAAFPAVPTNKTVYQVPIPGQSGAWYRFTFEGMDENRPLTQLSRAVSLELGMDDASCG